MIDIFFLTCKREVTSRILEDLVFGSVVLFKMAIMGMVKAVSSHIKTLTDVTVPQSRKEGRRQ